MRETLLSRISSPDRLRELSAEEHQRLAAEIRERLMEVVNLTGGHLASNLGVVELTLALHTVFDFLSDRIVWDVSHQTYCHKIITGRNELFGRLRQYQGCCGFASKDESPYDLFDAGHAGTSISAALGIAVAEHHLGRKTRTVAVIGDASIAAGMPFEAMNHAGDLQHDLLVILNDNRMSIDKSVGGMSRYLNRIRSGAFYRELKRDVQVVLPRIPIVGKPIEDALEHLHGVMHQALVPGQVFEDLGFKYFGPVNGHDLPELIATLSRLRSMSGPVLLHVLSDKGFGFAPAQNDPIKYHASKGFLSGSVATEPPTVKAVAAASGTTFGDVFRDVMVELGEHDPRVVGITAAMPGGTGLSAFQKRFPERYYDVGIAEQHGTCYASGLALGGLKPVFAVYSTFLQRGYDQVIHDVCLQRNRVVFALDRAGLVEDGPTHHGVFDIAYMRVVPNVSLAAPADADELREMLRIAVDLDAASAIRYTKAPVPTLARSGARAPVEWGKAEVLRAPQPLTILAYGSMVEIALEAERRLREQQGIEVGVVNMRFAKPLDAALLRQLADPERVLLTIEEHVVHGGFGSAVLEHVAAERLRFAHIELMGVPDRFVSFGSRELLLKELGLDAAGVAHRIVALRGRSAASRAPANR
ncbi:MAG: 1-deoxy-D-xylulose-5-phosphate synthase [Planctomycetota bacterium]